jgi:glycosyltransferase involved in cell wall biosynthesis
MAVNRPVVISDRVNIHHEISAAQAGLVVAMQPGDIAQALRSLLDNPTLARKMGTNGRRLVSQKYSWPVIVRELTAKYGEIIRAHVA